MGLGLGLGLDRMDNTHRVAIQTPLELRCGIARDREHTHLWSAVCSFQKAATLLPHPPAPGSAADPTPVTSVLCPVLSWNTVLAEEWAKVFS